MTLFDLRIICIACHSIAYYICNIYVCILILLFDYYLQNSGNFGIISGLIIGKLCNLIQLAYYLHCVSFHCVL